MKNTTLKIKKISISILGVITFVTLLFYLQACSKESDISIGKKEISIGNNIKQITKFNWGEINDCNLKSASVNSVLLDNLINSTTWGSIPQNILSDISYENEIIIASYVNSSIQTISIRLKSNLLFKNLVFYHLNGKFLPALISSEQREDKTYFSVSDLSSYPYFDYYLDNNNRIGLLKIHKSMPSFGIKLKNASLVRLKSASSEGATCPEVTDNFFDCIICAARECGQDWEYTVLCALEPEMCVLAWSAGCLIF